jgi:DNA sulfur modification protein DndD
MFIKEIELNNFRIYKGTNRIELLPNEAQNIVVVSGKNGFGKTTFLMSLVWCLYGRQMEKVDELYKKEIWDKGGYPKFIGNSLNRLAASNGQSIFSVAVTFTNVKIPDITCHEIKIIRSYNTKTGNSESLEILIDGHPNQITDDLTTDNQNGGEIFIREFILPIEIAKFFFFDAEKIVSLAEVNSREQRKSLGIAYSEVLGIHKYEELKNQLVSIQDDYRKESAKPADQKAFIEVEGNIQKAEIDIADCENRIEELTQSKVEKKGESDKIQRTLIQEGNHMTIEEVNELKGQESELDSKIIELQSDLKELFDLIPFGLAGDTLMDVSKQLSDEQDYRKSEFKQVDVENKTDEFLNDLERDKNRSDVVVDINVRRFYEDAIKGLIKKHFYSDVSELPSDFESFHDFSDTQVNQLNQLINNLRQSFKESFTRINHEYSQAKNEIAIIRRKLSKAEKDAEDSYISDLRAKKDGLDRDIQKIEEDINSANQKLGEINNDLKTYRSKQTELRKKIDISKDNKKKNDTIEKEIKTLKNFIAEFKERKKVSLEGKIKNGLNLLMHKRDFISKVSVDISLSGEDIEISLFTMVNGKETKVDKGALSMGERQMYSSALLNALVDESNIEFPVFIDSPMQKFDKEHAENIIKHFYPQVSDQVVLFPLIHKELTEDEYELLKSGVSKSFLINNLSNDSSEFIEVEPNNLITKYNELYVPSN